MSDFGSDAVEMVRKVRRQHAALVEALLLRLSPCTALAVREHSPAPGLPMITEVVFLGEPLARVVTRAEEHDGGLRFVSSVEPTPAPSAAAAPRTPPDPQATGQRSPSRR